MKDLEAFVASREDRILMLSAAPAPEAAPPQQTSVAAAVALEATPPQQMSVGEKLRLKLEQQRVAANEELIKMAVGVRSLLVGNNSAWKCEVAARALHDQIQRTRGLEARLGHGKVRLARGAFVDIPGSRSTLPDVEGAWRGVPVPEGGAPHAFVRFDDGSILDLTADQFDSSLPRVWWPADPARYREGAKASLWEAVTTWEAERTRMDASKREAERREWWH